MNQSANDQTSDLAGLDDTPALAQEIMNAKKYVGKKTVFSMFSTKPPNGLSCRSAVDRNHTSLGTHRIVVDLLRQKQYLLSVSVRTKNSPVLSNG